MVPVLALGAALTLTGVALLANLFGAGDFVIRRVTSRSLGELAPGFASSTWGFRTYATLIVALGVMCLGISATVLSLALAADLLGAGAAVFLIASVVAVAGEVVVYRRLKR